jgi:hypothetical protein
MLSRGKFNGSINSSPASLTIQDLNKLTTNLQQLQSITRHLQYISRPLKTTAQELTNTMTGHPKLDMAGVAAGSVVTADQLLRFIEATHEGKEDHAKKHATYAAVSAAVAVGALELLRRDEEKRGDRPRSRSPPRYKEEEVFKVPELKEKDVPGHTRRMAEEVAGLYALGEEIMGHKKHRIVHTVMEALGTIAAIKDASEHTKHGGME